jgi:hypothetical protein
MPLARYSFRELLRLASVPPLLGRSAPSKTITGMILQVAAAPLKRRTWLHTGREQRSRFESG